ncbi:hypothetical protein OF83DRAFT_656388 [Amylostereum chailletii]|nr:hypothetical protein OF83DRAFT_656388 [Amylostereum chailletii]
MSSKSQGGSASNTYVPKSNNSPFGGWKGFMRSYGLKPEDLDDVEEGKKILEAFKEQDRDEWEEAQKAKSK